MNLGVRTSSPLSTREPIHFPSPSSSSSRSRRAEDELSCHRAQRRPNPAAHASFLRAPSRAASPRNSSTHPRARLSHTPAESSSRPPAAIDVLHRSSALPSTNHLRPFSARLENVVSFPVIHSTSPALSPFDSRAAAATHAPPCACRGPPLRRAPRCARAPPPCRPASPAAGNTGWRAREGELGWAPSH